MKRLILCTIALSVTTATFGQIKIADSSFETNLQKIDIMSQPFNLKDVLKPFDAKTRSEFKSSDLFDGTTYPIGEKIMMLGVDEDGDGFSDIKSYNEVLSSPPYSRTIKYYDILKINHKKRTAELVPIKLNAYYTVKGVVLGDEGRDSLRKTVCEYIGPDSLEQVRVKGADTYSPAMYRFFNQYSFPFKKYFEKKEWYSSFIQYFILEDDEQNEYYISSGHLNRDNTLSVKYYENLTKYLVGQKVALVTTSRALKDAYTGTQLTNLRTNIELPRTVSPTKSNLLHFDYTCTDIILKDRKLLAVLEDGDSRFTQSITDFVVTKDMWIAGQHNMRTDYEYVKLQYQDSQVSLISKPEWDRLVSIAQKTKEQLDAEAAKAKAELEAKKKAAQQAIIAKYGATIGRKVLNHQVELGMTQEMCRDSWGSPSSRTESQSAIGTQTVWSYYNSAALVFFNGKLVEILKY